MAGHGHETQDAGSRLERDAQLVHINTTIFKMSRLFTSFSIFYSSVKDTNEDILQLEVWYVIYNLNYKKHYLSLIIFL